MDEWVVTDLAGKEILEVRKLMKTSKKRNLIENGNKKSPPAPRKGKKRTASESNIEENDEPVEEDNEKSESDTELNNSANNSNENKRVHLNRTIIITRIPFDFNRKKLVNKFKQFGEIESVQFRSTRVAKNVSNDKNALNGYIRFACSIILCNIYI